MYLLSYELTQFNPIKNQIKSLCSRKEKECVETLGFTVMKKINVNKTCACTDKQGNALYTVHIRGGEYNNSCNTAFMNKNDLAFMMSAFKSQCRNGMEKIRVKKEALIR